MEIEYPSLGAMDNFSLDEFDQNLWGLGGNPNPGFGNRTGNTHQNIAMNELTREIVAMLFEMQLDAEIENRRARGA